jgi:hypothetical protein
VLRRLLIVTSCIVFLGSPLADVLCYANCPSGAAAAGKHSCSPEPDDSAALNGVSHACSSTVDVAFRIVEIRPILAAVASPSLIFFNHPFSIVRVVPAGLSTPLELFPQALTPLRL